MVENRTFKKQLVLYMCVHCVFFIRFLITLLCVSGDRKFKCDWPDCGKAFRHSDNLKVHYRQHTNEKPIKCPRCDYCCRQKSSLQWHTKKVHPETLPVAPTSNAQTNAAVQEEAAANGEACSVGPEDFSQTDVSKADMNKDKDDIAKLLSIYDFDDEFHDGLEMTLPELPGSKSPKGGALTPKGSMTPKYSRELPDHLEKDVPDRELPELSFSQNGLVDQPSEDIAHVQVQSHLNVKEELFMFNKG